MEAGSSETRRRGKWLAPLLLVSLGALLLLRTFVAPTNHDEDQYLAGAAAAMEAAIYRDFLYLQTPLQAWLFAPLADWLRPHAFLGLRLVGVLLGIGTLAATWVGARRLGCGRGAAALSVALICFTEIFQYSATTLRNDILPTFFLALFLMAGLAALQRGSLRHWFAAGLCIGLATAAKVSFALPALAGALFLLHRALRDKEARSALAAYAAGGAAAAVPVLFAFARAPEAFWFGVVRYHSLAPFDWYSANGLEERLGLAGKLAEFLGHFAQGPALAMLLLVLVCRLRTREASPAVRFLDFVLAGALVAAWLPTPSWQPYLAPVLLPLALLFALCVPRLGRWSAVLVPFALYGMVGTIVTAGEAAGSGSPLLAKQREAHWLGAQLRACEVKGPVASFTARWVVDSGYPLDRRFAPGVFVFRSGRIVSAEEARRLNVAVPATLAEEFDRDRPGAILVGDQMGSVLFRLRPDLPLRRYAVERGWKRVGHPEGRMSVFINPKRSRPGCTPLSPHA